MTRLKQMMKAKTVLPKPENFSSGLGIGIALR